MSHRRKTVGMINNKGQHKSVLCPHGVNVDFQDSYKRWNTDPFEQKAERRKSVS